MTVLATDSSKVFNGSGNSGPFSWSWRFFSNSDVTVKRVAGAVEIPLMLDIDYTITGAGSYPGGSLTLLDSVLQVGEELHVSRDIAPLQNVDLRNSGDFFPDTYEDALDRHVMMVQDRDRRVELAESTLSDLQGAATALESRLTQVEGRAGLMTTSSPKVFVRDFMDGQGGRPTYAAWLANQTGVEVTAAVQAAINTAYSAGGGVVEAPAGTLIVNNVLLKERVTVKGMGRGATKFKRNSNYPAFAALGPAYDGVTLALLPWYRCSLIGLTVSSIGNFDEDLVQYKGITSSLLFNVELSANGCTLLLLHQVWDSRFMFCEFLEGGTAEGRGAVVLKSGYGYRQTKEIMFYGCRSESYVGPALFNDSEADTGPLKTQVITLTDWKFESVFCATRHINLYLISGVWFKGVYVTTKLTPDTEAVVSIGDGQHYHGDITIYFSVGAGLVMPKSGVRLVSALHVDMRVCIASSQEASMWAVDWDGANASAVNIEIYAPYPLANGRYLNPRTMRHSTVRQRGTATDAVQYVFAKDGRIEWSLGNPYNPASDWETLYLRASNTNFFTFAVHGDDPAADYKEIVPGGHLQLTKGYNSESQLRIGDFAFWIDAQGRLRREAFVGYGSPANDLAGNCFQTNDSGATANRPAFPVKGQQFYDETLGKPIWWSGAAWKDATGTAV